MKIKRRKKTGLEAYVPTSQTPRSAPPIVPTHRSIALSAVDPTYWEFIITRHVRTAQFGCSSLRTSATYKESKEARLSLIPYRTRKSENGESRLVDSVCAGIDSRRTSPPMMSKERLFSVQQI